MCLSMPNVGFGILHFGGHSGLRESIKITWYLLRDVKRLIGAYTLFFSSKLRACLGSILFFYIFKKYEFFKFKLCSSLECSKEWYNIIIKKNRTPIQARDLGKEKKQHYRN
jgi:hypothetical protein